MLLGMILACIISSSPFHSVYFNSKNHWIAWSLFSSIQKKKRKAISLFSWPVGIPFVLPILLLLITLYDWILLWYTNQNFCHIHNRANGSGFLTGQFLQETYPWNIKAATFMFDFCHWYRYASFLLCIRFSFWQFL